MKQQLLKKIFILLAFLGLVGFNVNAQDETFDANTDAFWTNSANWTNTTLPTGTATIQKTVDLNASTQAIQKIVTDNSAPAEAITISNGTITLSGGTLQVIDNERVNTVTYDTDINMSTANGIFENVANGTLIFAAGNTIAAGGNRIKIRNYSAATKMELNGTVTGTNAIELLGTNSTWGGFKLGATSDFSGFTGNYFLYLKEIESNTNTVFLAAGSRIQFSNVGGIVTVNGANTIEGIIRKQAHTSASEGTLNVNANQTNVGNLLMAGDADDDLTINLGGAVTELSFEDYTYTAGTLNITNFSVGVLKFRTTIEQSEIDAFEIDGATVPAGTYVQDANGYINTPGLPTLTSTVNNGAWNNIATWGGVAVPTSGYNVIIANSVVINDGSSATCNNLEVNPGKLFTISDTGSLDVGGTLTIKSTSTSYGGLLLRGTITGNTNLVYERNVNMAAADGATTGGNDLITAPFSGQPFNNFVTANPNLKTDPGSTATLFGTYNNTTSTYATWDESATTALVAGTGYRSGSTDGGTLSFTGTTGTTDVDIPVSNSGDAWNLIGNPYPCYIHAKNFIENANNQNVIDSNNFGIYAYDGDVSDGWLVINNANSVTYNRMTPGQGFFVKKSATAAPTDVVKFLKGMRLWAAGDDYIVNRTVNEINNSNVKLQLNSANRSYNTNFYFNDNASLGFDIGYDSGLFEAVAPEFSLYSHVVENNTGVNLAIQSLNPSDAVDVIVPLGVNANAGTELSIAMPTNTLPSTFNVYIEDTLENTLTLLNSGDFVLTPSEDLNGTGRFFLRVSSSTLSSSDFNLEIIQIYSNLKNKTVVVNGLLESETKLAIYDIQGRLILQQELESSSTTNTINVSTLNTGIYVAKVENGNQIKTQKVIIK